MSEDWNYSPRAIIDHAALRHNLERVRAAAPDSRVWSVIKADGYGHGLLRVAKALRDSDGFAVARIEEGLELREAGVSQPILLLSGVLSEHEFGIAAEANLEVTLHHERQLTELEHAELIAPLDVWIKADTGMHRLGFMPDDVPGVLAVLKRMGGAIGRIGILTHLANADDREDPATNEQLKVLQELTADQDYPTSIGNSAGILAWEDAKGDWVRPGIMLYGSSPFIDTLAEDEGLVPVMTLQASVIAVRQCREGDALGYGGTYVCPKDMLVGVLAVGYGDGYPRHAETGTPVLIGDTRVPLVGRVSMDSIMVDLSDCPDTNVGDTAVLWGRGLPAEEIARHSGTITYELFCNLASRVEFVDENQIDADDDD